MRFAAVLLLTLALAGCARPPPECPVGYAPGPAAPGFDVRVRVLQSTSEPAPGVCARAELADGEAERPVERVAAPTDAEGYALLRLTEGRWRLSVLADAGCTLQVENVTAPREVWLHLAKGACADLPRDR